MVFFNLKKSNLLVLFWVLFLFAGAQTGFDVLKKGNEFILYQQYDSALSIFQKGVKEFPEHRFDFQKKILYTYYQQRNYADALVLSEILIKNIDADVEVFHIAGLINYAIADAKNGKIVYEKGLQIFPQSGLLYNGYGDLMLEAKKNKEAIQLWEKGILLDPNYAGNYYPLIQEKIKEKQPPYLDLILWCEIFINLESLSSRTQTVKKTLWDLYDRFLKPNQIVSLSPKTSNFEKTVTADFWKAKNAIHFATLTPAGITQFKQNFLSNWFQNDTAKLPNSLFSYWKKLNKKNLLSAYDYWVFGDTEWLKSHPEIEKNFIYFRQTEPFKIEKETLYLGKK